MNDPKHCTRCGRRMPNRAWRRICAACVKREQIGEAGTTKTDEEVTP